MKTFFGIDYGSKLTGNTVIAIFQDDHILFMDIDKGVDADNFILNAADHFKPELIFIDAPLSLPGVYRELNGKDNYHFREADIELKAMSPMFLGGLAARAIELKSHLEEKGCEVYETYPRIMAERFKLKALGYKGSLTGLKSCVKEVGSKINSDISFDATDITTWHHLDALLALMSAMKHDLGQSQRFGDIREGQILI